MYSSARSSGSAAESILPRAIFTSCRYGTKTCMSRHWLIRDRRWAIRAGTSRRHAMQRDWLGDVEIPAGTWRLGSSRDDGSSSITRNGSMRSPSRHSHRQVSGHECRFRGFIEDGGYHNRNSGAPPAGSGASAQGRSGRSIGWRRTAAAGSGSVTTKRRNSRPCPVIFVNWYEAQAWCNWQSVVATEANGNLPHSANPMPRFTSGAEEAPLAMG